MMATERCLAYTAREECYYNYIGKQSATELKLTRYVLLSEKCY